MTICRRDDQRPLQPRTALSSLPPSYKTLAEIIISTKSTLHHIIPNQMALLKPRGEGTTEEILDAFLLMYRTKLHLALNDCSPAETLMGQKSRTIRNALLPKDSTFL
ncbi:hypothetical protein ACTXT7_015676 [Hymenolepis weldensis]